MADSKYLIYGDDERIEAKTLEDLAEKVDNLLEIRQRDLLKAKTKKKPKKKEQNNVQFAQHVKEELNDIEEEDMDYLADTSDLMSLTEDPVEEKPAEEPVPEKKKKKKSKFNPLFIIIPLGIVILGLIVSLIMRNAANKPAEATPTPTTEPEVTETTPEPTVVPTETPVIVTSGKISSISNTEEYTVEQSLAFVKNINETIKSYLDTTVAAVERAKVSDNYDIEGDLEKTRMELSFDLVSIETYTDTFAKNNGSAYLDSAKSRLSNIYAMISDLTNKLTVNQLVDTANGYIEEENKLAEVSKNALMAYLESHEIEYSVEEDTLTYEYIEQVAPKETTEPAQGETTGEEQTASGESASPAPEASAEASPSPETESNSSENVAAGENNG